MRLDPLRSFLTEPHRRSLSRTTSSHGVSSPRAQSAREVHQHGALPAPLPSAYRFSQPPDGLLLHEPCGLVSCRLHLWGSPFRAFPSQGAAPPLGGRCPHVVTSNGTSLPRKGDARGSRLQGFAPLENPLHPAHWLGSQRPDALLGLIPSRVFTLLAVGTASSSLPS
jgi:hypothetical protein